MTGGVDALHDGRCAGGGGARGDSRGGGAHLGGAAGELGAESVQGRGERGGDDGGADACDGGYVERRGEVVAPRVPIVAALTTRSAQELVLREGSEVWASFKAMAVHLC